MYIDLRDIIERSHSNYDPAPTMNAFLATIRTSFRRQLTYRAANLSGLATNLMFAFF